MPVGRRTIKSMNRSLRKSCEERMLVKVVRRVSAPFMGYLFVLLGSALLGLFVEALASRSGWAAVTGVALGCSLVAAVVGFRKGAMKLAQCGGGDPLHWVNILSEPLRQEEVDQYYVDYRGGQRRAQSAGAPRA